MLKKIVSILGGLILIVLMFLISLIYGIKIDNISYKNIYLNELYLKYDKKLILTLNKLEIKNQNEVLQSDFNSSDFKIITQTLNYFKLIKINSIEHNDKYISLEYKNKTMNLTYKDLQTKSNSQNEINFKATIKNNKLYYKIFSDNIDNIKFLKNFFKLNNKIDDFLYKQLSFNSINLESFFGYLDLNDIDNFSFNSIYSTFKINKPKIKFSNNNIIHFDNIVVTLKDKDLNIKLNKENNFDTLTIDGNLNGNIDTKEFDFSSELSYKDLRINSDFKSNKKLINYNISTNHIKDIKIFDNFFSYSDELRVWIVNRLKIKNVKVNSATGKIYLKDFFIDLKSLKIDATINNAILDFNPNKTYPVKSEKVILYFNGKDLLLKFVKPYSNDVKLDGTNAIIYDIFDNTGILLNLKSTTPINKTINSFIKAYDIKMPANIDILQTNGKSKVEANIDIPFDEKPIKTNISIINHNGTFSINKKLFNFKNIDFKYKNNKVYIKNLSTIIDNHIIDTNNIEFDLKSKIATLNLDISMYKIYNNKNRLNNVKLFIDLNDNSNIKIKDNNNFLKSNILINKNLITDIQLNNIDIIYSKKTPKCENIIFDLPIINFNFYNGSILYNDKYIKYDKLNIKTKGDRLDIKHNINNLNIDIKVDNQNLKLNGKDLDTNFLNNLFGIKIFTKGIINIDIKGTQCILNGNIKIDDLILKEYKIKNSIANVNVNRDTSLLRFNNINAQGENYFIKGDAQINLYKNEIDSKLNINFMKNYSSLVSKIPLFGYILLGDDKGISYELNIQGDLNNPEITTKFLEETTLVPINILKRVITLPLKPFDKQ
ncbi:MAG: AsmA-like C-terminal domain-containing protein [Campylobacterota bacterium]|nr:AsmA-like C-terminal domain-containing protein [Campylobacterota bacterium]